MRNSLVRLLLVLGAMAVALLMLEVGARRLDRGEEPPESSQPKPYDSIPDPELGYRPRPASRFRARKSFDEYDPCYDVVYSTDAYGRREVGTPADVDRDRRRLVLFGCSYAFGEGLPDEETLQFKLGRHFEVVNYAVYGYGVQHTLALLRGDRLPRELTQGDALGLFVLHPFHFRRAMVTSELGWIFDSPYFVLEENGELHQFPTLAAAQPRRAAVYRVLNAWRERSALLRRIRLRWPIWMDPRRTDLVAAMLIESARRFEERWHGPFVVAVEGSRADPEATRALITRLRAADVTVIDHSAIEVLLEERLCGGREHPGGIYNDRLAHRLLRDLREHRDHRDHRDHRE